MNRTPNPYDNGLKTVDAKLEMGWDEGYAAGLKDSGAAELLEALREIVKQAREYFGSDWVPQRMSDIAETAIQKATQP